MDGKTKIIVQSDMEANVKAKQTTVEADMVATLKGNMVKIN